MKKALLFFIISFSFVLSFIAQNKSEIDSLELALKHSVDDIVHVNNLNQLSELFSYTNQDTSLIYAENALLISQKISFQKGILTANKNIATAYYFKSSYSLALDYFLKAIVVAEKNNDQKELSSLYNVIGVTYKVLGFYFQALEYYYKALEIAEETGDKKNISSLLNNIAIVYKKQGTFKSALKYYNKSLIIAEEIDDKQGVLIAYNNIGVLHMDMGNSQEAKESFFKSLSLAKQFANKNDISNCYTNIGSLYKNNKDYSLAIDYYKKSVKIKLEIGDKKGISVLYNHLSLVNLKLANLRNFNLKQHNVFIEKSIKYGENAFLIAKEIEVMPQILSSSKTLMNAYRQNGNNKKALEFSEVFIQTKDSLFSKEKSNAITEIEIKYETEKKEIENIALKKESELQKKQNRRQGLLIIASIIILFLFLIMILIVLRGRLKQKKTNKLLIKNNKLLNEKNKELLAADEELKQNNEELFTSHENANAQKEIIEDKNQALKDSEAHFRLAQEAGKIGTWEWDVVTDEILWSNTTYEIFGLKKTSKTISNEKYFKYVHPDDKQRIIGELNVSLKNRKKRHKTEYRIVKDGKIVWVSESSKLFLDDNGKLIKTIGVIQDITKQKLYQQTLQESEQKFRAITDSANDAIILMNNEGNVEFWNKAAEDIFGYKESEMINKNIIEHLTPKESRTIDFNTFIEFQKTGTNSILNKTVELLTVKKGGEIFPVEISSSTLKINGLWNVLAIIKDITERKKTDVIIKEKNEQQKLLINNIPAHIYFKDTNLKYVLANDSYAELFNLSVKDMIGKTDSDIANSEISDFYENLDKQVIKTKKPEIDLKREHIGVNGKIYWDLISKMPHFDSKGNVNGVIGIVQDITNQMRYEQELKTQKNILEIAHKDITDSISYAKTIQYALLPSEKIINSYFKDIFILFKPKETVSGDFYYLTMEDNHLVFAVADCTGHGVPGGFLTMLGITYINDIIKRKETYTTGGVLDMLRSRIKSTFKEFGSENSNGLDIALCAIDTDTNSLQYSGAYNPLWIIRNNELQEFKATRNPIGYYYKEKKFENHSVQLQDNDLIYLFSDGYQDQIGGELNKKFLVKRFRELLLNNHSLSISQQKDLLDKTITEWRGKNDQIDDITVMGIRWHIS